MNSVGVTGAGIALPEAECPDTEENTAKTPIFGFEMGVCCL
jgi:hypothetical protein